MTTLSIRTIDPRYLQVTPRNGYYKLKYGGDITILSLLIYCPSTKVTQCDGKIKFRIRDKVTIQSLRAIDNRLSRDLSPYKPILVREDDEYSIQLYPNPKLMDIYHRDPKIIYIHIKSIRMNPHLNTPLIYIK